MEKTPESDRGREDLIIVMDPDIGSGIRADL